MSKSKDEIRLGIIRLGNSLLNANHIGEVDMIVGRIQERCKEFFDFNTMDGVESLNMLDKDTKKYRDIPK